MKVPTLVVKFKEYAELDEIKRDAHAHNMNVSEYIRYLVAKERKERGDIEQEVERIRNLPKRAIISQKEMGKYRTPQNDEVRE